MDSGHKLVPGDDLKIIGGRLEKKHVGRTSVKN